LIGQSIGQIGALARISFLESVRHRAILGLFIIALLLGLSGMVLSGLSLPTQATRVATTYGLFTISFLSVVIGIIMGVILMHKELQQKTVYTILSKPVPRPVFILGKYLGISSVLTCCVTILALQWFGILHLRGADVGNSHILAMVLIAFEVLVVTAVAMLCSTFSSPVLSGIFTFFIFFMGRLIPVIDFYLSTPQGPHVKSEFWPIVRPVLEFITNVVPDLSYFHVTDLLLLELPVLGSYVFSSFLYALTYISICLILSILIFQRKDLA